MPFRYEAASSRDTSLSFGASIAALTIAVLLSGCAGRSFIAGDPGSANFVDRAISAERGPIRVTVAVPDARETEALTGLPLYEQGIQPVWLKVTNNGSNRLRVALSSIDPDYYSPLEVAWMNRGGFTRDAKKTMERWFHDNAIERRIPPGESRSGLIYTHLVRGTKGFNVDIVSAPEVTAHSFTFFVPLPGFVADYMEIDFTGLYTDDEKEAVATEDLRARIREARCCGTDETGTLVGDVFNVVLVATPLALRRALLRGGWQETRADSPETAIARKQRYRSRRPDGTFMKMRADGRERKELRLWLTPIEADSQPVWVGQVLHSFGGAPGESEGIRLDPDIDEARNYFLQDLWYSQSVSRVTYTRAFEPVSESSPVTTFTGSRYHTDGLCAVVWLSESTVALDDVELLGWWEAERGE
jgi:hypothetical protein